MAIDEKISANCAWCGEEKPTDEEYYQRYGNACKNCVSKWWKKERLKEKGKGHYEYAYPTLKMGRHWIKDRDYTPEEIKKLL